MPEKEKKPEFVVTDRRLFSSEGELRQDVVEDEERRAERERENREAQQRRNEERAAQNHASQNASVEPATPAAAPEPEMDAPSVQEQQASAEAYKKSASEIDAQIEKEMRKQGRTHSARDFEVSFEKFTASIYMTALMQLGLAAPQGEKPVVDLIGARQTIDTLAMLQEKTKGNLTPGEEGMFQNILYELRMAYLEVTNLITNPPPQTAGPDRKR